MRGKYFKIFSGCIVVNGYNRSLILDIQRENSRLIPGTMNSVIDFFQSKKNVNEAYEYYGKENKIIVDEYLNFLIENEFGFFVRKMNLIYFQKLLIHLKCHQF